MSSNLESKAVIVNTRPRDLHQVTELFDHAICNFYLQVVVPCLWNDHERHGGSPGWRRFPWSLHVLSFGQVEVFQVLEIMVEDLGGPSANLAPIVNPQALSPVPIAARLRNQQIK